MADQVQRVADMLSAPMEEIIVSLGTGVARAQRELDRFSIESQREISEDPLLAESGISPTFYQIPSAELELNIAIVLEEEPQQPKAVTPRAPALLQAAALKQIHLQPINATYVNQFSFNVNASSKLKLKIVPVPPPGAESAVTAVMSREQVTKIASSKLSNVSNARLAVNFNAQSRSWFVLQYKLEGNDVNRLALVVVDDLTGQIIKSETKS